MKIIDLLNKIANGEEDLPAIIVGGNEDKHYYNKDLKEYINQRTGEKLFEDGYGRFLKYYLNDEVEIPDDEDKKKKIPEKLYKYMEIEEEGCYENILRVYDGAEYEINEDMSFVIDKINSIIDYLKSKGDE